MLTKRKHIQEELDNLELQGEILTKTLDGLSRINRWLGNTRHTLKAVQEQFQNNEIKTILDLGCGGGDNLRNIAQWCQKTNKQVRLIGIDGNQNSLDYAQSQGNFEIEFLQADILNPSFEIPECDLLISSHFLYHFKDEELVQFLKKTESKVRVAMIFSELKRSKTAYGLFQVFGIFFGRMVKSDGLKAIERSFKSEEISEILSKAELSNISVQNKRWFRYLATIEQTQ